MHSTTCLNCNTELTGKFCHECGQKADTHRITAQHFITHDLVHGVWHIDKGIFYTFKQALTRPGYAAKEYIDGKRVKFYNIFYIILMLLAFTLYLGTFAKEYNDHAFLIKATYLMFVPLYAIAGLLFFPRLKYNFFEHAIIGGMVVLCMLILVLLSIVFEMFPFKFVVYIRIMISYLYFVIPVIIYYQATATYYKIPGFAWRIVLTLLFVLSAQYLSVYLYKAAVYSLS